MIEKPYQQIPIQEIGEPLVPISSTALALVSPHPYQQLGAPYGEQSPYSLRQGVLAALLHAQQTLQQIQPGWRIQIFDAYRPLAVQQFMVDHTLANLIQVKGLDPKQISPQQRRDLLSDVYQFWALPSEDPATPPPHSTGAAVDLTLLDHLGQPVAMGGAIDELSCRSYPNYYGEQPDAQSQHYHHHRQLLYRIMRTAGFHQHPQEWWHFCLGDQMWAWLERQIASGQAVSARYGRMPLAKGSTLDDD